jgi:Spy/CpxP family protein refolding chaperone
MKPVEARKPFSPLRLVAIVALVSAGAGAVAFAGANDGSAGAPAAAPLMFGMHGGARLDRALDRIGASDEQKAQIDRIVAAARADLQADRDHARSLHEQAMQVFTRETVDADAAEALRQQMLAEHDRTSRRMLQSMLEISQVLTPEQRQQLAAQMNERRATFERRRAERLDAEGRTN